jgi:hypothetical protein
MSDIGKPYSPRDRTPPIYTRRDDVPGLEIARGRVAGTSEVDKFGWVASVGASYVSIWDVEGHDYNWPTGAAKQYNVSSSTAVDQASGSGAQVMTLYGLDGDFLEASEDISLNGQSTVVTVNSYSRVFRAVVGRAGGNGTNTGHIWVYTGASTSGNPNTTASVVLKISPTMGQTLMAVYTVPANKVAYMCEYYGASGGGKNINIRFRARPDGGAWNTKHIFDVINNTHSHDHCVPHRFEPKTDMEFQAKVDSAPGTSVAGVFGLILIDKTQELDP